ncbi:MAG: hypothetical protein NC340_10255 [Ruminococcus flavefaciens]|nr:hypothetical protein [Ruminococcus flavefaciens]MCM1229839.1 hypothetical protein [Ruminococcus flavefaciens]
MANYNSYLDVDHLTRNPFDLSGEIVPQTANFSSYPHESVTFELDGVIKYPANLNSLMQYPLSELAKHVLCVIATYEVVTTKMVTECLNLMGIRTDSDHVLKATERLRKTGLIHSFRFVSQEGRQSNYITYRLSKPAGESTAHTLGVSVVQLESYSITEPANLIKLKLAVNQIIFAYIKHCGKAVAGFEKSKRIYSEADESAERKALRPSLVLTFSDDTSIMYEAVRRDSDCTDFWKNRLKDKLERYLFLFNNWANNNWKMGEKPLLVMCCESVEHSVEVKAVAEKVGIDVLFTHDLLMFGENFEKHIYSLDENNNPEYYRIQIEG